MKIFRLMVLLSAVAVFTTALSYAAVPNVELKPTPLNFNEGDTTAQQMGIYISNVPAPGWLGAVSFYLVYDKSKLTLENFALNTTALQNLLVGQKTDGAVLSAGRFSGTGTIDPNTAVITFDVKLKTGTEAGDYPITFKTADTTNNYLWDSTYTPIANVQWVNATVSVSAGPPNPAHITGWQFVLRQKKPVNVRVNFTGGNATRVQYAYKIGPNGAWTNITETGGTTVTITGNHADLVWQTPAALDDDTTTVYLRARVFDRTQSSDWNEAPNALTVDNEAPKIVSVSGRNTTIVVTFQQGEWLDDTTSQNSANYTVSDQGAIPAKGGITVTDAELTADNEVTLTVSPALSLNHRYRVTASGIQDHVGNVLTSGSKNFDVLPNPVVEDAALVRDGLNTHVDVTFSKPMKFEAPLTTAAQWTVTLTDTGVASQATTIDVTNVQAKPGSGRRVARLTLAQPLQQNAEYRVAAPVGSKDDDDMTLQAGDEKATFSTPFWHTFAAGLRMLGVPLDVAGRVVNALNAEAVASYDAAADNYVVDRNDAGSTPVNFEAGRGYFARFDSDTTVYFDASRFTSDVSLAVAAGWSIITNPFLKPSGAGENIELSQVTVGGTPVAYAWHYDGSQWRLVLNRANPLGATNVLEAWKGYFIKAAAAGNVTIAAQTTSAQPAAAMDLGDKPVLVRLVARAGDAADAANVCGVGSSAVQISNPPLGLSPVDLYFVGKDSSAQAVDVRTGPVTQKWEAVVTTSLPNTKVTVGAPDLSSVPPDYSVVMTDKDTGKKIYLRTSTGYTFTSGPTGATRRLVIEIVPRSQVTLLRGVGVQQAGPGNVVITFQLNGPASVSAEVRNIAGRVVRQLVSGRTETAGTHTLSWNLTNTAGSPVPRGTYLVVLKARTEDGQQTQAVRPFSVNR